MTKFADPKFSVPAALTPEYAEGYARTFPASAPETACTECAGTGSVASPESTRMDCPACEGTGLRSYQLV